MIWFSHIVGQMVNSSHLTEKFKWWNPKSVSIFFFYYLQKKCSLQDSTCIKRRRLGGGPWKNVLSKPGWSVCSHKDEGDCRYDVINFCWTVSNSPIILENFTLNVIFLLLMLQRTTWGPKQRMLLLLSQPTSMTLRDRYTYKHIQVFWKSWSGMELDYYCVNLLIDADNYFMAYYHRFCYYLHYC